MVEILNELFVYFVWEMGVLGQVNAYQSYAKIALIVLGMTCVFIGIKTYRLFFSISVFALIAMGFTYVFRTNMDWGAIVIAFTIVGTIFAFAAYNLDRVGAVVVSLAGVLIISIVLFQNIWIYILICLITLLSALFYQHFTVIISSVAFGSLLLREVMNFNYKMIIGLVILGIAIQYLIVKGDAYVRSSKKRN